VTIIKQIDAMHTEIRYKYFVRYKYLYFTNILTQWNIPCTDQEERTGISSDSLIR